MEKRKPSKEISVMTGAKSLYMCVTQATKKSPKQFQITYGAQMERIILTTIENLCRAHKVLVLRTGQKAEHLQQRVEHQLNALLELENLAYFTHTSLKKGGIVSAQFEEIMQQTTNLRKSIMEWMQAERNHLHH